MRCHEIEVEVRTLKYLFHPQPLDEKGDCAACSGSLSAMISSRYLSRKSCLRAPRIACASLSNLGAAAIAVQPTGSELLVTQGAVVGAPGVYEVRLNRPSKANALCRRSWSALRAAFEQASAAPSCRVIVLTAAGRHFTAGLDLVDHAALLQPQAADEPDDVARRAFKAHAMIKAYQDAISSLESCPQPVIAAVHGACIGAGVDLITAADVRVAR